MYKNILLVIALIFLSFASLADVEKTTLPNKSEKIKTPLEISGVWARKSMSSNNNSAAYMKINNVTDKQVTIIGASAPEVANNVELHKSFVDEKGISRMVAIDTIVVPANSTIELKQGGIHIMLFDLKENLTDGRKFPLTIKIEDYKPIEVESSVQ